MNQADATRVITGKVRISYEHLTQAYANSKDANAQPKFSVTLLIPKSDVATRQMMDAAIAAAIEQGVKDKWGGQRPPQPAIPIHDGDGVRQNNGMPFPPECRGHWVMTASSKQRPEVVDINLQPIIDPTQIYSGMYARVSVRFFPYNNNGKWGVGCGLNNVQKLEDGEPLGGYTSAAEDFGGAPAAGGYTPGYPAAAPAPAAPYAQPPAAPYGAPAAPPAGAPGYAPPPAAPYGAPAAPPAAAMPAAAPAYAPQPPAAYGAPAAPGYVPGYPAAAPAPGQGYSLLTGKPETGPVMGIQ